MTEFNLKNKQDRKHLFSHVLTLLRENGSGVVTVEINMPCSFHRLDG